MPSNPYARADERQRRARRRVEGWSALAGWLPLVGALAALPLLRGGFYGFLDGSEAVVRDGIGGMTARVGLALAAGLSLGTYDEVVRGPDRGVVDLHPLHASLWLRARIASVARSRFRWFLLASVLLVPLWPRIDAIALCALVLAGAWIAGIGAGLGVNLAAPRLAMEPALAGVFDAIRGENPRLQAALLYAPGVALALFGSATLAGSWGATEVLLGHAAGWAGLTAPFAVGALGIVLAARNAPSMERLPALLGEIEAAWAAAESPEEARAVYLEWTVRMVPEALRRDLRRELRHLWRGLRPWVTGSWGLAVLALLAGWTDEAAGRARLAWVGGAALLALGFAGVRLAATDPAWLDDLLPSSRRLPARVLAVFLVMQVVVLPANAALLVRQGTTALLPLEGAALGLAVLGAISGARLRGHGGLVYLPAGILVWALAGTC